ncbi:MAG: HPr family phosphocarrier protein [Gammaproteobacteria bacterium]|nr:HPr family phosphocarrier protein [Gammaproteobacteria bacterium]MYF37370.1 HPr family phosphocarrier protein [Gammaproteobacteria bacterium]
MLGRVKIVNKLGMHARASAKFVQVAKSFPCSVQLGHEESQLVNGKSMMQIMTLAATQGSELFLKTEGEEAEVAYKSIAQLIADRFGEPE